MAIKLPLLTKIPARWRPPLLALTFILVALALTGGLIMHKTITIDPAVINVRRGPGIDYQPVALAHRQRSQVIGEDNGWLHVRLSDHRTGWVASWLLNQKTKPASSLAEATIVIDPGHGGADTGAEMSANSKNPAKMEKTYTLKVARRVATDMRRQGARVILTRDNDRYVGLKPRPQLAESARADAFVSLHFDSSPRPNEGSGVTTYYYHQGPSLALSRAVSAHFNNLGLTNHGIDFGDYLVIRDNARPAILCELGYINSDHDARKIKSPAYQERAAADITAGVARYLHERH